MWREVNGELYRKFVFKDFAQAFKFMKLVAERAESLNHHPRWLNQWNTVEIWLATHGATKITDKDIELSKSIDQIFEASMVKKEDKKTTKYSEVKLYADGGSRGNPGPSASGYVILDEDNKIILEQGVYLGVTTNNQAEYQALKMGLEDCQKLRVSRIQVYMDSLLVVNQMLGKFKVRNRDLWPIHDSIKKMTKNFKQVSFTHVPRELNKLADSMVNKALDEHLDNQS